MTGMVIWAQECQYVTNESISGKSNCIIISNHTGVFCSSSLDQITLSTAAPSIMIMLYGSIIFVSSRKLKHLDKEAKKRVEADLVQVQQNWADAKG